MVSPLFSKRKDDDNATPSNAGILASAAAAANPRLAAAQEAQAITLAVGAELACTECACDLQIAVQWPSPCGQEPNKRLWRAVISHALKSYGFTPTQEKV